jgi:hypothetical protein
LPAAEIADYRRPGMDADARDAQGRASGQPNIPEAL